MVGQSGLPDREWAGGARKRWESADKPGSVEGNHPSGTHVAVRLKRPTRKPLRAAGTSPKARALPYLVVLQVGFAVPPNVATGAVRSYRTVSPLPAAAHRSLLGPGFHPASTAATRCNIGGLLSVALSVGSRPPGVTWHLALWSPDFPPRRETQRLPGRLPPAVYAASCSAIRRLVVAARPSARAHTVPCGPGR